MTSGTSNRRRNRLRPDAQETFAFAAPEPTQEVRRPAHRYSTVDEVKATGSTFTPWELADYLAECTVKAAGQLDLASEICVLDPAVGDGSLSLALLRVLNARGARRIKLVAYETNAVAAHRAREAIIQKFPSTNLQIIEQDFITAPVVETFDLAIANPPYVRTQILGAPNANTLSEKYGLEGRVDLYQAFTLEIVQRLREGATLGLITSNRFLSTRGSSAYRNALLSALRLVRVWDLGDTKLFDAAVLPALLVATKRWDNEKRVSLPTSEQPAFTSIYEEECSDAAPVSSIVSALDRDGSVCVGARTFSVRQGVLHSAPNEPWRMSSHDLETWLSAVSARTWQLLGRVAKVRVGIKTTADKVFIRSDWADMGSEAPELLLPLTTHHVADRFRARAPTHSVLYPHTVNGGRREPVDLAAYPRTREYLEKHRRSLEAREYVSKSGRKWYEIWVPQDPDAWHKPKVVFRDISEKPTFWLDLTGTVVNGDCYWISTDNEEKDLLWLIIAVANSSFIELFYDRKFNNRLYSGRRRFMTQYVEQFPLPDPDSPAAQRLIASAQAIYKSRSDAIATHRLEMDLDALVWDIFGVSHPRSMENRKNPAAEESESSY
jgi:hypothetical protein